MLRKVDPDTGGVQEYAVDPEAVARALAATMPFTTGFIPDDILYHKQIGDKQIVVGYRRQQKTGIWLEERDDPVRAPLPHLVLIRTSINQGQPDYKLYACKKRPQSLNDPLFHAPLPNIYSSGGICWGNISLPKSDSISLQRDWETFLGTSFGNHACHGKSKRYGRDVRQMLLELNENQRRRVYPPTDLIPADTTLAKLLGIAPEEGIS